MKKNKSKRLAVMQDRLATYDVFKWADDFLTTLGSVRKKQQRLDAKTISSSERKKIIRHFKQARIMHPVS